MIEFSDMREMHSFDIFRDRILIRHDILLSGHVQMMLTYAARSRKLKNPETINRYRKRSIMLFSAKLNQLGKTKDDVIELKAHK